MTLHPPVTAFAPQSISETAFARSILNGLCAPQKHIESKWLYDAIGSQLFDAITELEEYYPTRTELGILQDNVASLQEFVSAHTALVELGSGSSIKTRTLLNALPGLQSYVPVDISQEHLQAAAHQVAAEYETLNVHPVVADFTADIVLPSSLDNTSKILFFPGSTLGNFQINNAARLLGRLRGMAGVTAFVIGVDLVKDTQTLVRAYDDKLGVTTAFNLNLLTRINRELGADFDLSGFRHEARWKAGKSRIEMHLISKVAQRVELLGKTIRFAAGESIHTENSHKYTREQLQGLAHQNGWQMQKMWTDADGLFGVALLTPAPL
ncbi:L-histidine N(alpha)-methyltransferase [Candidatus Halocynthiibacter alkanivorans]|uniref:L-histidine N(alpha)-methyltransferase n=1 Tax=Candidatus Halocynthiibacter alkanivorans TaxID=2267619 RepID=UPI000DF4004C|nr:L-histidine N(alpha)-methyltransferase [Candidatus Halocynthiibacter alkanivorans]